MNRFGENKERIFDDLARFAGGAMTVMSGLTRQIREEIRSHVDDLATRMDLVPREDFERLEAMLAAARREQANLSRRLSVLEKGKVPKKPVSKSASKPTKKTKNRKT